VLHCVGEQLTGILGILLASCDSMYLTHDKCSAPERIHNDISGVRTYYAVWKNVFIFLQRTGTCTGHLDTKQLQLFDQRKFSECLIRERKFPCLKEENAYTLATRNKSQ
jgi:hypothetical protein